MFGSDGIFDSIGSFSKSFTPHDGGYIYYPSAKSGGKLITDGEFEALMADWRRVAGVTGRWRSVGILVIAIAAWVGFSQFFALPEWAGMIFTMLVVATFTSRLLRASLAPRRLVRGRPDETPPRAIGQARQQARAMLSWKFVIYVLVISGLVFLPMSGRQRGRSVRGHGWSAARSCLGHTL